jgi:hypothetical protein
MPGNQKFIIMKHAIILLSVCVFFILSCKKIPKDDVEPYKGKDYFPTNTGHELVYDVISITKKNVSSSYDTVKYQIKEIISRTYNDSLDRETQEIDRLIKNDTTTDFVPYKIWSSNLLTSTAHRVEDGIRVIKLCFPQSAGFHWDANSLNSMGGRYYSYQNLHVPFTMGTLQFDSTCTVLEYKDSSATRNCYSMEKYATTVGLIYKINQEIQMNSSGTVTYATVYTETIHSYKK